MYPTRYFKPRTLDEAVRLFAEQDEPAYLSGGHTLIPILKSRLAEHGALIDVRAIPELHGIFLEEGQLSIGAASTHAEIAASRTVADALPALAGLAGSIGDMQVRHMGTIGGSIANNDPSADFPAALLGLGAKIVTNQRQIDADEFFEGLFTTALKDGEVVLRLLFDSHWSAGYAKFRHPASRFPMPGSLVARDNGVVRVAITGAGGDGVFRWREAERKLAERFTPDAIAELEPDPSEMMNDIHGSRAYRAHLSRVMTQRAVENMGSAISY